MRATNYIISTLKETPADAEIISHQLMLRAGLIRRLASGLYTWMPLGLRVLQRVEKIIREEMNRAGAMEVLMPVTQPAELWEESGRWDQYGPNLLRMKDRHDRDFCMGPTHEEVITDLIRNEVSSYRQLPANFYQIQTKFRDETRPRFGVMRSREFIMKDAYSFHIDSKSLEATYELMYKTYSEIFKRLGLEFRAVLADTGDIGGSTSHEFQVLADSGEDDIAFSDSSDFAANIELAEAVAPPGDRASPRDSLNEVATPDQHSIADVSEYLAVSDRQVLKTLVVYAEDGSLIALCLRGDHILNELKAEKLDGIASPLHFASEEDILLKIGCKPGSIGPCGLNIPVIADHSAAHLSDFVCGANKDGYHFQSANWGRDAAEPRTEDLRNVVEGDRSPCGTGTLSIKRGIEVGHIFQLGTKYSDAMNANVLNENGKETTMTMGCYGIGVTRIVGAAIEQNYDEKGIIWPESIAPFDIALIPINLHKSEAVAEASEALYAQLTKAGFEVLYMDEPKARLGGMLADIELIGIPHRIVIGDRGLEAGLLEYRYRRDEANQDIPRDEILDFLQKAV